MKKPPTLTVLTVKEFSERQRISQNTTIFLIGSKQLLAYNVAPRVGGKPAWRITMEEEARFRLARAASPAAPASAPSTRKRLSKNAQDVTRFYPE